MVSFGVLVTLLILLSALVLKMKKLFISILFAALSLGVNAESKGDDLAKNISRVDMSKAVGGFYGCERVLLDSGDYEKSDLYSKAVSKGGAWWERATGGSLNIRMVQAIASIAVDSSDALEYCNKPDNIEAAKAFIALREKQNSDNLAKYKA